jgi:hypothetical protein
LDRPDGSNQETLQGIAEHLAWEAGRMAARCGSEAVVIGRRLMSGHALFTGAVH